MTVKHKLTKKALKAMPREKRRYWLDRLAKEGGRFKRKDRMIPLFSVGNYHVEMIQRIPMFLRDVYADTVEGRY